MPDGNLWRTSRSMPHARAAGPTSPSCSHISADTVPVFSNLREHGWRGPEELDGHLGVARGLAQSIEKFGGPLLVEIELHAARPDQPAAEPASAKKRGHVQKIAADAPAV